MALRTQTLKLIPLIIMSMSIPTPAQERQTSNSFVPGDVVIKFVPKTKIADSVEPKPGSGDPTEPLMDYVHSISAELGVPLQVKRLGSGGIIILTINRTQLLAGWGEKLRCKENVNSVQTYSVEEAPRSTEPSLYVQFAKGTQEQKMLSQVAESGKDAGPAIQSIVEKLRKELKVPLVATVEGPGRLQIKPDINALTLDVVERLKKKSEIEYAQPDFIRGRMGATGPPLKMSP